MPAWTERVPLRHASASPQAARLREPHGGDELALGGVDTRAAVQLLDRLLDDALPGGAGALSASDRDGLLAALHRGLWGDRVVSSLDCRACGEPYDLSFELSALQRQLHRQAPPAPVTAPRTLDDDGARLMLPSADEEDAAASLGVTQGAAQLLASIAPQSSAGRAAVCVRLDMLAPLIDVELETRCAECGAMQLARFDIQSFVLQRLLDEREAVLGEVHALASGYGWSLQDIVSLPRSLRRSLVQRLAGAPAAFG